MTKKPEVFRAFVWLIIAFFAIPSLWRIYGSTEITDSKHQFTIKRTDLLGAEIVTDRTTWIIVHGWNSSAAEENFKDLASSLNLARPNDQVLTLDWSAFARTGVDFCSAASHIVPIGASAASTLSAYGFQPSNLNLVGHSFGAYVVDEIAKRLPSKVRSLVALDPAANACPGAFDPVSADEVDFARDSAWSWAFHASSLGNEYVPVRAHEAFIVDSGLDPITAHSAVVNLFAFMVSHQSDPISSLFGIDDLFDNAYGLWVLNKYSSYFLADNLVSGYEAIIYDSKGINPTQITYTPTAPIVKPVVSPRSLADEFAVLVCGASDAGHGDSGISSITINGFLLPESTCTGTNIAFAKAAVWLQPGINTIQIVAADGFFQKSFTTNYLSISRTSTISTNLQGIKIDQPSGADGSVSVKLACPLGASVNWETSTNLVDWRQAGLSASVQALDTITNTSGAIGILYGSATLMVPKKSLDATGSAFYRANSR